MNGLVAVQERDLITFEHNKVELIKQTVAKGATDQQLALFLHQAQRTGLDPLARQIHCVLRYNSKTGQKDMSIQTAIDGYRLIADRTGQYAGSDDYLFDDGLTQYQHLCTGERYPVTATVTVYKIVGGQRVPFTATVAWDAYFPGDKQGFMWRKMPYLMLGKCAEGLALRKAFPAELSGVYVREEMQQAGFVESEPIDVEPEPVHEPGPDNTDGLTVEDNDIDPGIPDHEYQVGDNVVVMGRDDEKPGTITGLTYGKDEQPLYMVKVGQRVLRLSDSRFRVVDTLFGDEEE